MRTDSKLYTQLSLNADKSKCYTQRILNPHEKQIQYATKRKPEREANSIRKEALTTQLS